MSFVLLAAVAGNTPAVVLLCIALTCGVLFYTFYSNEEVVQAPEKTRLAFLRERKDAVYENLRDLKFEYKAGKFPESDYEQMRTTLEEEAAALLAEIDRLESGQGSADNRVTSVAGSAPYRDRPVLKGARQ